MKLNSKSLIAVIILTSVIFIGSRLVSIIFESEEDRIIKTINKAKKLTERENIIGLSNYISVNYSDESGNDKTTLLFIARTFFSKYKNVLIVVHKTSVDLDGDKAAAAIESTVYWQENNSPDITFEELDCAVGFIKIDKAWKLINLEFRDPAQKRLFNPNIG